MRAACKMFGKRWCLENTVFSTRQLFEMFLLADAKILPFHVYFLLLVALAYCDMSGVIS